MLRDGDPGPADRRPLFTPLDVALRTRSILGAIALHIGFALALDLFAIAAKSPSLA